MFKERCPKSKDQDLRKEWWGRKKEVTMTKEISVWSCSNMASQLSVAQYIKDPGKWLTWKYVILYRWAKAVRSNLKYLVCPPKTKELIDASVLWVPWSSYPVFRVLSESSLVLKSFRTMFLLFTRRLKPFPVKSGPAPHLFIPWASIVTIMWGQWSHRSKD